MIDLGQKAKDKITGFSGTLTARAQYLTGCDQYALTPSVGADNKIPGAEWFDEGRIEVTGPGITAADVAAPAPGGPQRETPLKA